MIKPLEETIRSIRGQIFGCAVVEPGIKLMDNSWATEGHNPWLPDPLIFTRHLCHTQIPSTATATHLRVGRTKYHPRVGINSLRVGIENRGTVEHYNCWLSFACLFRCFSYCRVLGSYGAARSKGQGTSAGWNTPGSSWHCSPTTGTWLPTSHSPPLEITSCTYLLKTWAPSCEQSFVIRFSGKPWTILGAERQRSFERSFASPRVVRSSAQQRAGCCRKR